MDCTSPQTLNSTDYFKFFSEYPFIQDPYRRKFCDNPDPRTFKGSTHMAFLYACTFGRRFVSVAKAKRSSLIAEQSVTDRRSLIDENV